MTDIQDTLSGGAGPPPPLPPPYQPGRPHQAPPPQPGRDAHAQTLAAVQSQLAETQASLASHMEKIRSLEGMLAEHEVIKREVSALRSQMDEAKRDMDGLFRARGSGELDRGGGRVSPIAAMLEAREAEDDEDDNASVSSVDTVTLDSDLRASPKKSLSNGLPHSDIKSDRSLRGQSDPSQVAETNVALASRLENLSSELDEATKLGQVLRNQHSEASETIRALEDRVQGLEKEVDSRVAAAEGAAQSKFADWKVELEAGWRKQQDGWETERKKLLAVIRHWEERSASGSDEDDDGGDASSRGVGAIASTSGKTKGKRSRPRRKRRGTAIAGGTGGLGGSGTSVVGDGPGGSGRQPRATRLAELPMDDLASDSDSTAIVGSASTDDLASKAAGDRGPPSAAGSGVRILAASRSLLEADLWSSTLQSLPVLSAAAVAVVFMGVAAAYYNKVKQ